jgi:fermentation-respiration switch protein FrsA (DUF1100 family)
MLSRILVESTHIAGWPALHAAPAALFDAPLPTVLVYHGFTRSKELDSNLALMLACAGLRAVMPEADGHGVRFEGDAAARQGRFWDILMSSIDELPRVRDDIVARGWVDAGRVGVAGLSLGGFVVLGALARYDGLRAGVSWMGAGHFSELSGTLHPPLGACTQASSAAHAGWLAVLADYDPSRWFDRLARQPLLLWHGVRDEVVPFAQSVRLHAELVRRGGGGRVELVLDPAASHKLPLAGAEAGVAFLAGRL